MTAVPPDVFDQLTATYRRLAYEYRPMAPSDGYGRITVPKDDLDLDVESEAFAVRWWKEENEGTFWIGNCHFPFRPAMVCAVSAAQYMCAGTDFKEGALRLLRMAIEELEKVPD